MKSFLMHRNSRAGFSMMEILVVVGVIAVLIAILIPSLGRMRERARAAYCLANLKQIGSALHLYAADNSDYMPPRAVRSHNDAAAAGYSNWPPLPGYGPGDTAYWTDQALLGQYANNSGIDTSNNNAPLYFAGTVARRSIFVCPSDTLHPVADRMSSSYAMGINFTYAAPPQGYSHLWKSTRIDHPSTEMVIVDGVSPEFSPGLTFTFLGTPDDASPMSARTFNTSTPDPLARENWARRHNNGANLLFFDGKAKFLQDLKQAYDQRELTIQNIVEQ